MINLLIHIGSKYLIYVNISRAVPCWPVFLIAAPQSPPIKQVEADHFPDQASQRSTRRREYPKSSGTVVAIMAVIIYIPVGIAKHGDIHSHGHNAGLFN
jgi:hypothetical protein